MEPMNYTEYEGITSDVKPKVGKSITPWIKVVVGVAVICFVVFKVANYFNDPQRVIDKEAKQLYDEAVEKINAGDYDSAIEMLDNINVLWSKYKKVKEMKTEALKGNLFELTSKCVSEEDYESIIKYITENIEDIESDSRINQIYSNSVQQYKKAIIDVYNECLNIEDYEEATSVLKTAMRLVGEDSELMEKYSKISILKKVKAYTKEKNFEEAIKYINDNLDKVGDDFDILEELTDCEEAYRNYIIDEASKIYSKDGYESAITVINEGLNVLIEDSILENKKEEYEAMKPVWLTEMEIFSYGYDGPFNVSLDNHTEDRYGNTYTTSFSVDTTTTIKWLLNGKYEKMTGTIACPKGYLSQSNYSNVHVTIYCDGNKVFKSDEAGPEEKPQSFSINLTGVEELEFKWTVLEAWNIWEDWCVYGTIFDGALYPNS